jgi:hypothetical protein
MVILEAEMESEPRIEVVLTVDMVFFYCICFGYISYYFLTLKNAHRKIKTR